MVTVRASDYATVNQFLNFNHQISMEYLNDWGNRLASLRRVQNLINFSLLKSD